MRAVAMKTFWRLVVAAAVLAGGGVAAWMYFAPSQAAAEPDTVIVERGSIEETVLASGALGASAVTSVGAQVSGTIKSLRVKLGDAIAAGDVIAEIDSLDQENAVKSAEAQLANVEAQKLAKDAELAMSKQALERATQLHDQALIANSEFLNAQVAVQTAEAALAGLEAQIMQQTLAVESAKLDLSRTTISAPVSGTVVAVLVTEGQSVNAAQSAPTIVKIADLDEMVIKAQISEADVTRVTPGQDAFFTILGEPDNRIRAKLLSIEPAPDAIATEDSGISGTDNAIYYNGLFAVENPDHRLRIAMTAQITIVVREARDTLIVPAAVLGRQRPDGSYTVEVYDPATSTRTPATIRVGLNNNIVAQVIEGLEEGQQVVSDTGRPRTGTASGQNSGRPMMLRF
jgi:membrane fusion protein, macrolide-specific efflux system